MVSSPNIVRVVRTFVCMFINVVAVVQMGKQGFSYAIQAKVLRRGSCWYREFSSIFSERNAYLLCVCLLLSWHSNLEYKLFFLLIANGLLSN